jgi:hypothetical protein
MKYLFFILLMFLFSCNDGGSDPEFVNVDTVPHKLKTDSILVIPRGKVTRIENADPKYAIYMTDTDSHDTVMILSDISNQQENGDTILRKLKKNISSNWIRDERSSFAAFTRDGKFIRSDTVKPAEFYWKHSDNVIYYYNRIVDGEKTVAVLNHPDSNWIVMDSSKTLKALLEYEKQQLKFRTMYEIHYSPLKDTIKVTPYPYTVRINAIERNQELPRRTLERREDDFEIVYPEDLPKDTTRHK